MKIKRCVRQVKADLRYHMRKGFRVIYTDETMFTKSTIPDREWSHKHKNVYLDIKSLSNQTTAIVAAVSQERGIDLVMTFRDSVNISKYKVFIEELRARYFFDDICLYFDNLAVHRSRVIKERLDELGIAYIFNPPYSPEFNGIEYVFSIFKNKIKRERLNAI